MKFIEIDKDGKEVEIWFKIWMELIIKLKILLNIEILIYF